MSTPGWLQVLSGPEKAASGALGAFLGAFLVIWVATGHTLNRRRGTPDGQ